MLYGRHRHFYLFDKSKSAQFRLNLESAIEENGLLLQEISNDAIDKKLVLLAVRQNGLALRFAPEEFRNDAEIARIAVQENKHAFLYVLGGARNDIAVQFKRWIRPNINNFLVGFVAATCIGRQASDSKLPLFALGFLGTLGGSVSIMISWDDDDDALDDDASPSMF